ncbi:bifunctional adenosylcobinamide kinase/adenosylcobinamide-phosphate guanylyltransferase [Actinosynnema pretiosum subsp. pretiosum]|uniref:Adenosylcobinamide kinase n=2 Tax=Actinosynnema TaxID=40566 RepID=C6W9E8_ACTMD|nr:bifunctional adenosylcobinamide kinase/adenosylcobinamide-phosphate guanylyltransferase [Actinosynnema mirum]ACU35311.1 cobalbumin biosynthesis protein [Actinosynnema mirum DSM 43827]AXX28681.1 Adenosylcobinamide-phosphate guanylyltransferase [Actinosynnema pretiosum subsp. pretiosum]QUF06994.1 bifunctional adenosylcobinamide kinase/adenosylcobinamide-phosphate guanylyltransferase [Actinosynnema pretiosum subsp. pretiosum]
MTLRTLVLGGTRSGKSAHAEGLLTSPDATYVATARRYPDDPDWDARIARHVRSRPASWRTAEVPSGLPALLPSLTGPVIVDDLATWLTNVLDDANAWEGGGADEVEAGCAALVDAVAAVTFRLVLVSAEVGLGVVPSTRSGRLFRDHLGSLNARLAEVCDEVTLVVAGIPLRLREAGGSR